MNIFPRHRGIALLLVLFAVATATILGVAFINAQATSTRIAQNIDRHAVARHIAESALAIGIKHVETNATWRSDHTHGVWIADEPLLGGAFTLRGEDDDGDLADDTDDPLTLTAIGTFEEVTHSVSAVVNVEASGGGALTSGLALSSDANLTGSATIDSWDSSQGSYWSTQASNAQVVTNATGSKDVELKGSAKIKGDVVIGPGGDPSIVVKTPSSQAITGATSVADESFVIPANSPPDTSGLGSSSGNATYTGSGATTISQNKHVNDFSAGGSKTVNITGDVMIYCDDDFSAGGSSKINITGNVIIYCEGDFTIDGSASVQVSSGSSLKIYVAGDTSMKGSGKVNTNGGDPAAVELFTLGSSDIDVSGSAEIYARIRAPDSPLSIVGSAAVFGTYQGQSISLTGSADFHQDLAPLDEAAGGGGGGQATVTIRWLEIP